MAVLVVQVVYLEVLVKMVEMVHQLMVFSVRVKLVEMAVLAVVELVLAVQFLSNLELL
ncbi:MAG: hypothetical protein JO235_17700 [Chroococcidiopsidaceae cyanobacterium CP_BM_RX_35]|nr:hypothetical protein [Chroococcidiopsidaceae cyanobacterium CP_BM_RX_35]